MSGKGSADNQWGNVQFELLKFNYDPEEKTEGVDSSCEH